MTSLPGTRRSFSSEDENRQKHQEDILVSEYDEQIRNAAPMLQGRRLTAALAFVAGTGFTLFGSGRSLIRYMRCRDDMLMRRITQV